MPEMLIGSSNNDQLEGGSTNDTIIGLAGNDTLVGAADDDVLIGDYVDQNLLIGSESANSFSQYAQSAAWSVEDLGNGHSAMTQNVQTVEDAAYTISFETAANIGEGHLSGTVEVLWNGVVIDTVDTSSAGFSGHSLDLIGTGGQDALTFRSIESQSQDTGPTIHTDAPIYFPPNGFKPPASSRSALANLFVIFSPEF